MTCINIDASFNPIPLDEPINTSLESHRQRIRHLYRRLGYGAGFDDINNIPSGTTFVQLVDTLIDAAASIEFPTEFDWTERGVKVKGYYCTTMDIDGVSTVVEQSVGTSCGVTSGGDIQVIQGDGTCLLYTSPSPRDLSTSRMPSSA